MKYHKPPSEKGSTLVYVAIILVVLLLFVALAIDVGHLYAERRHTQNAADAGALAGAWEICFGDPSAWQTTAENYAIINNGADSATATKVGAYHVNVVANENADTYIIGIIGINTVNVVAEAEAACGRANRACGLWPIAFDDQTYYDMPCGEVFYVWSDDQKEDVDCVNEYNCDVDGDGEEDIITADGRAWLDFSGATNPEYPDPCTQSGCGASELACQILSDSGAMIEIGSCVSGDKGVKAGVKNAVDSRIGDIVQLPLFNTETYPCGDCGEGYVVSDFGCMRVIGWEQQIELVRWDGANPTYKAKVVKVAKECSSSTACTSLCGGTSGGPPSPTSINAVSLVK